LAGSGISVSAFVPIHSGVNFSAQTYRKLKQLHRRQPFDLIQYPNYSSCGLFSIPFLRTTHIVRASSGPGWNTRIKQNLDSSLTERLEALQYKLTRNVYVPSRAIQKMLPGDPRLIRSPFYVETRDWDTTVYDQFLKGKKYALYFGRFQLHKGFHTLAQALPRFLNQYPDAYVALVGRDMETSLAPSMAAFARAQCNSSADRLIVMQNLPHSQLYPVIAGAHLVVLPSLIDNLPNACLEAMGLGKVVIGTLGTSFEELIVDGVNGCTSTDPARLEIKKFFRIDLANRGAVRALHVVGVNLKLRLRVDACLLGQQQVLVRLYRVGLLRAFANEDLAVENRPAVVIENPFVQLVTAAMRLLVVDDRVRVGMLIGAHKVKAVDRSLSAFVIHHH